MKTAILFLLIGLTLQACGRKAPLSVVPGAMFENTTPDAPLDDQFEDYFADPDEEPEDDE